MGRPANYRFIGVVTHGTITVGHDTQNTKLVVEPRRDGGLRLRAVLPSTLEPQRSSERLSVTVVEELRVIARERTGRIAELAGLIVCAHESKNIAKAARAGNVSRRFLLHLTQAVVKHGVEYLEWRVQADRFNQPGTFSAWVRKRHHPQDPSPAGKLPLHTPPKRASPVGRNNNPVKNNS